jgi:polysaccharide export outer membrane protein
MRVIGFSVVLTGCLWAAVLPAVRAADEAAYVIESPDILRIDVSGLPKKGQPIEGAHLVRPDGTVGLGTYGSVSVSGLTPEQARVAVLEHLAGQVKKKQRDKLEATVEVQSFNSKCFYLIADSLGGEQVYRLPCKGNETVKDAIGQVSGLSTMTEKSTVWIARPAANGKANQILRVDWRAIVRDGQTATNYLMLPGDRVYVGDVPAK